MNSRLSLVVIVAVVLLLLLSNSLYVIKETERAVKLRFGEFVQDDIPPGLHFKVPFVNQVRKFDARILTLDTPTESFFTVERKRLLVDSYVKWRIVDVGAFYRATGGSEDLTNSRLSTRVNDGLRNQFGTLTLNEVVSGERDTLMETIQRRIDADARESLGIEVIDVRVKRIDLPDEVSEQVYRRMTAEREKEARDLRAQGLEQGERIRADADRQQIVIEANAYREAEQLRGVGDAQATAIYANAFERDPEFYAFTRSLNAYMSAFRDKGDVLLLDPDSDFFRYLNSSSGN